MCDKLKIHPLSWLLQWCVSIRKYVLNCSRRILVSADFSPGVSLYSNSFSKELKEKKNPDSKWQFLHRFYFRIFLCYLWPQGRKNTTKTIALPNYQVAFRIVFVLLLLRQSLLSVYKPIIKKVNLTHTFLTTHLKQWPTHRLAYVLFFFFGFLYIFLIALDCFIKIYKQFKKLTYFF